MAGSGPFAGLSGDDVVQSIERLYGDRPALPAESSTLRLVVLRPGKEDDALVCSLIEDDMLSYDYEALSYTWGLDESNKPRGLEWEDSSNGSSWEDAEDSGSEEHEEVMRPPASEAMKPDAHEDQSYITLNGLRIPVMQNLYTAMQYLRHPNQDRCLWIDYLCINQRSVEDKNSQVRRMDAIYRHASKVIVWLGLPTDDTASALQNLQRLTTNAHLSALYGSNTLSKAQVESHIKPLVNLLSRSWFTRVWVVQEVALAATAEVQIGSTTVPWNWFISAARTIRDHLICCADILHPLMDNRGGDYLLSLRECFANILAIDVQAEKADLTLHEALRLFYGRLATDPRDKIFALLGLLGIGQRLATVDYATDAAEVYTATAVKIIAKTGDLSILVDTDELAGTVDVPTWCPDWTQTGILGVNIYDFYDAAGGTRAGDVQKCTPLSLKLKGLIFDFVAHVVPDKHASESSSELWEACRQYQEWESLVEEKFGPESEYFNGDTYDMAFWYTVMMGLNAERTARLTEEHRPAWDQWRIWIKTYNDLPSAERDLVGSQRFADENIKAHNDVLVEYPATRWFFTTEEGYMGLGPINMEARDLVCILAGGKMPFVLRAVDETCEACGEDQYCYQFVGFAYVHGFMDGGLTDGIREGTEEWREFCLR